MHRPTTEAERAAAPNLCAILDAQHALGEVSGCMYLHGRAAFLESLQLRAVAKSGLSWELVRVTPMHNYAMWRLAMQVVIGGARSTRICCHVRCDEVLDVLPMDPQ